MAYRADSSKLADVEDVVGDVDVANGAERIRLIIPTPTQSGFEHDPVASEAVGAAGGWPQEDLARMAGNERAASSPRPQPV